MGVNGQPDTILLLENNRRTSRTRERCAVRIKPRRSPRDHGPRDMRANTEGAQTDIDGNEINAEIAPQPQDVIIRKLKPSGFHGTPLTSLLTNFKADSLIVAGTSTSGCVRATVIDAFSENYRVAVVEEGCFDRFWTSHAISLCDIHAKYGDVIGIDEATEFIEGLPADLFDLPSGTPL